LLIVDKAHMTATSSVFDVDVVVVGAGPVGLLLSAELALGGVSVLVLERAVSPSETIKAGSINIASAEILARRGLLAPARAAHERAVAEIAKTMGGAMGLDPQQALKVASHKAVRAGHFAAIPLDNEKLDTNDPDVLGHSEVVDATLVVQRDVEHLLLEHCLRLGVLISRGVEVSRVDPSEEGVVVHTEKSEAIRARYVVGCDGGRSIIRKSLKFPFPGTDPEITGRQAVVDLDDASKLPFGWQWTLRGVFRYGPMPGVVLTVEFGGPPADRTSEVTAQEIEDSLKRVSGLDVRVRKLHGTGTRWTDNARQVTTYRTGRVFLAGDAAHVHSPFSGQGLNLGLGDATNLGWKLAATIAGWAPEGLLDTYQTERHPIAEAVLDWTRAQVGLMRPDVKVQQLRAVVADLMSTSTGMTQVINTISGVTQRVEVQGEDPRLGRLVPDMTLADGSSLRTDFATGRFVLVDGSADLIFHAAAAPWPARVRLTGRAAAQSLPSPLAMLVRPDGVVVWTAPDGDSANLSALTATLRQWAGAPAVTVTHG
jgi:2-polyprenyl-6-methoxyphenol hydroxylase-like FAD-dependent oxidoreductase